MNKYVILFFSSLSCALFAINIDTKSKISFEQYADGAVSYLTDVVGSNDQLYLQKSPNGAYECFLIKLAFPLKKPARAFATFNLDPNTAFEGDYNIPQAECSTLFEKVDNAFKIQQKNLTELR